MVSSRTFPDKHCYHFSLLLMLIRQVLTCLLISQHGRKGSFVSSATRHDVLQVDALRWVCLQNLLNNINKSTVLQYACSADAVTDTCLMEACLKFLVEADDRYIHVCYAFQCFVAA